MRTYDRDSNKGKARRILNRFRTNCNTRPLNENIKYQIDCEDKVVRLLDIKDERIQKLEEDLEIAKGEDVLTPDSFEKVKAIRMVEQLQAKNRRLGEMVEVLAKTLERAEDHFASVLAEDESDFDCCVRICDDCGKRHEIHNTDVCVKNLKAENKALKEEIKEMKEE